MASPQETFILSVLYLYTPKSTNDLNNIVKDMQEKGHKRIPQHSTNLKGNIESLRRDGHLIQFDLTEHGRKAIAHARIPVEIAKYLQVKNIVKL